MFTKEEKRFMDYWEHNRMQKKKVIRQLSLGLPLGVTLAVAIFINVFSGWDKRAGMVLNANPTIIIVLIVAVLAIVIFIVIFSVRHKWDLNEQRYRELVARKTNESGKIQ